MHFVKCHTKEKHVFVLKKLVKTITFLDTLHCAPAGLLVSNLTTNFPPLITGRTINLQVYVDASAPNNKHRIKTPFLSKSLNRNRTAIQLLELAYQLDVTTLCYHTVFQPILNKFFQLVEE